MALGMEAGLGPSHIVLDGDPASPPLKGQSPNFRPMSVFGQTTGWTKMALGMEVGLGPGHIVLDGSLLCAKRAQQAPIFSARVYCGHGRPSQLLLSSCSCK